MKNKIDLLNFIRFIFTLTSDILPIIRRLLKLWLIEENYNFNCLITYAD